MASGGDSPGGKGRRGAAERRTGRIDDAEIRRAASEGDIGVMVSVVLSGEGKRLLGLTSPDPKTQNFLDNVPIHMEMISSIHEAASKGKLREIQARLDRRKFAIAKEPIVGATPLHSAVLGAWLRGEQPGDGGEEDAFKVNAMIRYLGGRFPESLNQRDRFGRTPLHYACALERDDDRLGVYETLQGLGADPNIEDSLGLTPEYYVSNPNEFPHEDLLTFVEYLKGTDAAKEAKNSFSSTQLSHEEPSNPTADESQESSTETDEASTRSNEIPQPMDMHVLWTEEGQYLAQSLGEPLVRGLAEVSQKRPKDPVKFLAHYLQSLAVKEDVGHGSEALGDDSVPTGGLAPLPSSPLAIDDDILPHTIHSREERDEHGQTAIHVAASRPSNRGALLQLIQETRANIALRDELYKTPRDVAVMADLQQNVFEIDVWIQMLVRPAPFNEDGNRFEAPKAEMAVKMLKSLLLDGYDHILDATSSYSDGEDVEHTWPMKRNLLDAEKESSYLPVITLLKTIPIFEERREWLHSAIRAGSLEHTQEILFSESESFDEANSLVDTPPPSLPTSPSPPNTTTNGNFDSPKLQQKGNVEWAAMNFSLNQESSPNLVLGPEMLAIAKNRRSRCSMHVAVLCQHLEIVRFIAQHFPQTLHIGDNLERTPLHYAMGVESVDNLSSVLIQAGAKRVQKDLRGKQPSYYFINKSDIQKLQDEEIFRE
ncbi:uncharacterized protein [Hetaerina americana]|uniref:uncharacterized protein n=1 Tax=Hetaerina americana TaxID=62018 RepID=UPI003A7F20A5